MQSYYEEEHLTITQCKVAQMQDKLAPVQEATVQGQVEADQKKREVAVAEKKLGTGGLTIL